MRNQIFPLSKVKKRPNEEIGSATGNQWQIQDYLRSGANPGAH